MINNMTQKYTRPDWAFICAAGFGERMRPLTDSVPKPLVEINGRPLLDYTIDHLMRAGITDIVLNTHYLHKTLQNWAMDKTAAIASLTLTLYHEETLLDTGGGLQHVLEQEKRTAPFFMINGDAFWENSANGDTLSQMMEQWAAEQAQLQLLLQEKSSMKLTQASGDYHILKDGQKPKRAKDKDGDYMFAGVRIAHPDIIKYAPETKDIFSFLCCMDGAESEGLLSAHIHQGAWHHISTPQDVKAVSAHLENAANLALERQAV
jgi:MurNAc alpha-1-phosphate uridylyltransferase